MGEISQYNLAIVYALRKLASSLELIVVENVDLVSEVLFAIDLLKELEWPHVPEDETPCHEVAEESDNECIFCGQALCTPPPLVTSSALAFEEAVKKKTCDFLKILGGLAEDNQHVSP
ncbi:hypothetical protein TKK_0015704 [Trichogramma kaykai]